VNAVIATVSVRRSGAGTDVEVRFEFPTTGQTVCLRLPDGRPLEALRQKAGLYLERLMPMVARRFATLEQATSAFSVLVNKGRHLTNILANNDLDRILELEAAFRASWPAWQSADWSDPDRMIPLIELYCHDDALPLEMLPLFDFGSVPEVRTYDDLVRVANRFLGFATVVRRVTSARMSTDHVLRNVPALPVQFMRHSRLRAAGEEERFLSTLGEHIQVDGPWPVSQNEHSVRQALTKALYDGCGLDGTVQDPPVQVHHFACHCDTTAKDDDDYVLRLSTKSGARREISFGQLREAFYERYFAEREHGPDRAVIILNACGSSRTNPLTAFSFPQWFLSRGHRAFIGTEATVPDGVASEFAAAFYGRLLEQRRPLGEAVVWARRDLLRDFRNPLGLLYVMYGDTDLTIEAPRPGIYRSSH
jgi:hypothetical protein